MTGIQILMIVVTAVLLLWGLFWVLATFFDKGNKIFNPIKKDNSDYRFIDVKNEKTRSIFMVNKR